MNITIDGINLRNQFGLAVVNHEGKFTVSSRKGETSFSFPDENGEHPFVNDEDVRFEPNNLELTCVLYGSTKEEFVNNYKELKELLEKPGLRKLKMSQVDGTIHEVYISDGARINLRGKWIDGQIISDEFTLPFVEPNPMAQAISFVTSATAAVTGDVQTSSGQIIADFGDGTVSTLNSTITNLNHDYTGTSGDKQLDVTVKDAYKAITAIDLASYDLKGATPYVLGKCKNLTTLDLSGNSLDTYTSTYWDVPDGISIDISTNSTLSAAEISKWLVDLDNPRADLNIPQNGVFTATGCNGGVCSYADLTTEGQAAHDDLETSQGWTMNFDI